MRHRHRMPFGAEVGETGVRFALWAPSTEHVWLVLDGAEHEMQVEDGGWRGLIVPGAGPGARYGFRIGEDRVPDPASRFQPDDVKGLSQVVDPAVYDWQDGGWRGRPWEEVVIMEVHVGTATEAGTFAALAETLEDYVALGVTAIELMPLSEFHGNRNWGYDGVLPYAPDASYGSIDDLKRLVDRAHGLGLMMFLDVVYNHFGPVGNHLSKYAAPFFTDRHQTPWGAGLNVDGPDGRPVREFFIQNALFWIEEYRFDGLRFDAVSMIMDDSDAHLIGEFAERIRAAVSDREVHLILENEHNQARWLTRGDDGAPRLHNAQWNDDIHHCWHVLLTGEQEGYYEDVAERPVDFLARGLSEGFGFQGEPSRHAGGKLRGEPSGHLPPSAFVSFLQNHDQIGNRAFGDRLAASPDRMALARAALLLSPQIPLMFMGEEWGASTPFRFFVDFEDDPDLSKAVRDGRRREFKHFAAFSAPGAETTIPDPTGWETFLASKLDRSETSAEPHAAILGENRRLLALRHRHVVALTKTRYLGSDLRRPDSRSLDVTWRYEGGQLRFAANFGEREVAVDAPRGQILWTSDDAEPVPDGAPRKLASWRGFWTIEASR